MYKYDAWMMYFVMLAYIKNGIIIFISVTTSIYSGEDNYAILPPRLYFTLDRISM